MLANPTLTEAIDFGRETPPAEVGMSRAGVQRVVDIFEQLYAQGLHPGAQLVVLRHGRLVLDRTIGVARKGTTQSIEPDTPFMAFSVTKPLTAMCIHKLVEEGRLDLDAPIAAYWPEFGRNGKESATIRHALLHQAGIPAKGLRWQIPSWWNWDRVVRNVAGLSAEHVPGTRTAYHLVNYGFILGELVRRVTGRPIEVYMRTELFEPLGMAHSYLGLPRQELGRAAEIYSGTADQRSVVLLFRRARHAVMPAASLNAPARDIARFYQMVVNGGTYAGHQIVRPNTVDQALAIGSEGIDEVLGGFIRWGLGFGLGGPKPADAPNATQYAFGQASTPATFGHTGQRSSIGWGDQTHALVVAFTCNQLASEDNAIYRWQALADAIWAAVEG